MKKLMIGLLALTLLGGCAASAPPVEQKRYPVKSSWSNPEPCVVGIIVTWSNGEVSVDRVPENMVCPPSA
jgi:hypothetical protein